MEIEVKGHSGCRIDIVNDGKSLFISKSTEDRKYIPRLLKQAQKQQKASACDIQHIRIPEIFGIDQTENSLAIRMEYVYSKNFVTFFEDAGFDNINYFIKALKIFIDHEIEQCHTAPVARTILTDKFDDVYSKVLANPLINSDKDILRMMEESKAVFYNLPESILLPLAESEDVNICHGDLTFSNILFNGNNYYLIDFLDSFIESPLIDIVKIRQDSCFRWSLLMYDAPYDDVRMRIIHDSIDRAIVAEYSKYDWYREYYLPLQLMNLLRVLQYAKEPKVVSFLKSSIESII